MSIFVNAPKWLHDEGGGFNQDLVPKLQSVTAGLQAAWPDLLSNSSWILPKFSTWLMPWLSSTPFIPKQAFITSTFSGHARMGTELMHCLQLHYYQDKPKAKQPTCSKNTNLFHGVYCCLLLNWVNYFTVLVKNAKSFSMQMNAGIFSLSGCETKLLYWEPLPPLAVLKWHAYKSNLFKSSCNEHSFRTSFRRTSTLQSAWSVNWHKYYSWGLYNMKWPFNPRISVYSSCACIYNDMLNALVVIGCNSYEYVYYSFGNHTLL